MSFLFWLSLVVGGGLLLLSLVGGSGSGHDVDDIHHNGDHGSDWGRLLSIRNATYFLFGFGATGVLLQLLTGGRNSILTFGVAAITGLIAWAVSALVFSYLRRTDVGELHGDKWLIGRTGDVIIPISSTSTGKIAVTRAGQTQELLARPHNEADENPESWRSVMVVEVSDGIALVTPSPEESQADPTQE